MNKLILGKYLPLNSVIHRLDPRLKILCMVILLSAIFIPAGWYGYAFLFSFLAVFVKLAGLKFSYIIKSLRPMLFMLIFLFIINVMVLKEGPLVISFWFIKIHAQAIYQTLYIVCRLVLMIMITSLLTVSTNPLDLTIALERILKPLRIFKVPYHEIAMMISLALRFIPTIIEETNRIINAQKSRGVDFEKGSLKEKIAAILSLVVPLFTMAILRASDLANAMEARGYMPGKPRSRYRTLKYHLNDLLALMITLFMLVTVIIIAFII